MLKLRSTSTNAVWVGVDVVHAGWGGKWCGSGLLHHHHHLLPLPEELPLRDAADVNMMSIRQRSTHDEQLKYINVLEDVMTGSFDDKI